MAITVGTPCCIYDMIHFSRRHHARDDANIHNHTHTYTHIQLCLIVQPEVKRSGKVPRTSLLHFFLLYFLSQHNHSHHKPLFDQLTPAVPGCSRAPTFHKHCMGSTFCSGLKLSALSCVTAEDASVWFCFLLLCLNICALERVH